MDHRALENFNLQRDLSRRQCRWQEFLSQYDYTITYIKGEDNTVADTMSCLPDDSMTNSPLPTDPDNILLASVFSIATDNKVLQMIKDEYKLDPFCVKLNDAPDSCPGLCMVDRLMYLGDHLIIPQHGDIWETLFLLAHDSLRHFGFEKSYSALRDSYYWPQMRKDLEEAYIPSCTACQQNKTPTQKPVGPLHPTPVPDGRFKSIAIDFVGPLPRDEGFNKIITITKS